MGSSFDHQSINLNFSMECCQYDGFRRGLVQKNLAHVRREERRWAYVVGLRSSYGFAAAAGLDFGWAAATGIMACSYGVPAHIM